MQFQVSVFIFFDSMSFFKLMCGLYGFMELKMSFYHVFKDEITGSCQVFPDMQPNNEKKLVFKSK